MALPLRPEPVESVLPCNFAALAGDRRSVRAFQDRPLPAGTLERLLQLARRAPSGANLQPGRFIQIEGGIRGRLSSALVEACRDGRQEPEDYGYFPQPMPMSLRRRQVAAAQALYRAVGVAREDRAGRDRQFERNFFFFDAPVALIVTIDREFGAGGYMDLGMTLYGLMLAAQAEGLASCGIGALASYPGLIRRTLGLGERDCIVCGMAIGYADPQAPVNETVTTRCELDEYFTRLR
ncbi:nitroreductase [Candidimonas humi]|uniref:Nitroreductase n=1 Tax=Candidimonas humi TaxID=683355 RepID=A0ABV8P2A8_9BURK|nr:nitroreductase [Candidimonas humi]